MRSIALIVTLLALAGCGGDGNGTAATSGPAPLKGDFVALSTFANPHAFIPAQCYIETAGGTQNACQFCHTNAAYQLRLGNNTPQAGQEPLVGNLQLEYSFAPLNYFVPSPSINPWENTLFPERLRAAVTEAGRDPDGWEMESYLRGDNWGSAYRRRPGDPRSWDAGVDHPLRLFPGLDPGDLPAHEDGFVRSGNPQAALFSDDRGGITGWRAVNFMPYGLFTPMTGSVSGIYIRLPARFMQRADGSFDLATYDANLNLLERAIQDRLLPSDPVQYHGAAGTVPVQRGLYPIGTEIAHPLHYVDVAADGGDRGVSPFPGTRSRRVKEIRYMYKREPYDPNYLPPGEKDEGAPLYVNSTQGWLNNGAGWILAGYIEDAMGQLRPQRAEELTQCLGCHSATAAYDPRLFTSGTGNTIDSTWSFPRKLPGALGWREMDYLGYRRAPHAADDAAPGRASLGDPLNRTEGKGEFRHFLDNVVGGSLYGEMPQAMERFMAATIRGEAGYTSDWPELDTGSAAGYLDSSRRRQQLMRELTARGDYLERDGTIAGALLYPPRDAALAAAARYRQVVVTERYTKGKEVFPATPSSLRYFRDATNGFTHQDGSPYRLGEVITDRPIDQGDGINKGIGITSTLVEESLPFAGGGTYNPDYLPLLAAP